MKLDIVASSKNDEFYTPPHAIYPIEKYLPRHSSIWCPFDTEDSHFVKIFREKGHTVTPTHLEEGVDFFECVSTDCDYIISNPPYSKKTEVLEQLFQMGKPFAMLVGVVGLFESKRRFGMFRDHDFEVMYFDKRIAYFKDYAEQRPSVHPPFSSVYVCRGILPAQLVFEELAA